MAVECIKKYRQKNGNDVLKIILKSTKVFTERAYFYCDASDEELVRQYTWFLRSQKHPYVETHFRSSYSRQTLCFHQEKAHNILNYYPDYINHINGVEFDNVNRNLDVVNQQQNRWCAPSKGYWFTGRSFKSYVTVNYRKIWSECVLNEVEACRIAYQLELQYEDYRYDFLKDRRKDTDILDLERTGQISEDEAIYRHILRYADNAWFYYRYNLTKYFADNRIPLPRYSRDSDGFMIHPITGQQLCPL